MKNYREEHVLDVWMLANGSLSAIHRKLFINHPLMKQIIKYPIKYVEIAITSNCKVLLADILEDVLEQFKADNPEFFSKQNYMVCTRCLAIAQQGECLCKAA